MCRHLLMAKGVDLPPEMKPNASLDHPRSMDLLDPRGHALIYVAAILVSMYLFGRQTSWIS